MCIPHTYKIVRIYINVAISISRFSLKRFKRVLRTLLVRLDLVEDSQVKQEVFEESEKCFDGSMVFAMKTIG